MVCDEATRKEAERDFFESKNVSSLDELRQKEAEKCEASRMPGKAKITEGSKVQLRRHGNVGNSLHQHVALEQSLQHLASRSRWF